MDGVAVDSNLLSGTLGTENVDLDIWSTSLTVIDEDKSSMYSPRTLHSDEVLSIEQIFA